MPFSRPLYSQWTINPINEWRCSWLLAEHLVIHSFFLSQHLVHSSISTNLPVLSFIYRSGSPSLTLTSRESTFPRVSLYTILFYLFYFAFWPCHAACGILVPQPGIKPVPPASCLGSMESQPLDCQESPYAIHFQVRGFDTYMLENDFGINE